MDTMSEMGAQGSETGSELAERVAGIAQVLTENGHTSEEVGLAMKVEYAKAQFLDDWQKELRDGRTLLSVTDWAAAQLTTALPSEESLEDLEVRMRALGSWAKIPYAFLTQHIQMVLSSRAASEKTGSSRPASTQQDKLTSEGKAFSTPERSERSVSLYGVPSVSGRALASGVGAGASETMGRRSPPPLSAAETHRDAESVKLGECLDRLTVVAERLSETRGSDGFVALEAARSAEEDRYADKVNALAGLEFKQKLRVIKDSEKDLDAHLREFQSILDMHSFGRRAIRPLDRLVVYKKTLQPEGIRWQIYEHEHRVATRKGRLPGEAQHGEAEKEGPGD